MNGAWPNAPSLAINMNFEKFYCIKAYIGAKFEQQKAKITKLGKTAIGQEGVTIGIVGVLIGTL